MLDRILDLFRVEYLAAEKRVVGTDTHRRMRKRCSAPIIDEILLWLEQEKEAAPPQSPLGKAYTYLEQQIDSLLLFVNDPRIALDNNVSERMLRSVAIGRKNFFFVGDDDAGEHLAVLQSLVATCALHGVNPTEYIADVLIHIQTHPANRIRELLPHRWMDLIERERAA